MLYYSVSNNGMILSVFVNELDKESEAISNATYGLKSSRTTSGGGGNITELFLLSIRVELATAGVEIRTASLSRN
jgi:hypothetical protein